ncbi:RNA-directed DNA polymerase from mobile element jockey [Aphis craccivora]|uniref:RNA-directed DNA polymerase from mobile element jockey n=1 Tax=Aphis craccivora TaxID=307492 RepID=A0A6G0WV04_APHCR|nr:RNA-directed DNA polymerase from mobile element jockey [Aphis craccivora]
MEILKSNGFCELLLSWFSSYPTNRTQYIKRSVLKNDYILLQRDLYAIDVWAKNIGLKVSFHIFPQNPIIHLTKYTVYDSLLTNAGSTVNDLGITLDRELTFHNHIEKSCCKPLKTLGFIKRVSLEFDLISPLNALFCTLVRSILEYGIVIWDLPTVNGMNQLERIQRKFLSFTTMVLHIDHLPHEYDPVLKRIELTILADRRVSANKVCLRNLINGSINCHVLLSQLNFKIPTFHSRITYPFFIPLCTTYYSLMYETSRQTVNKIKINNYKNYNTFNELDLILVHFSFQLKYFSIVLRYLKF